MSNYNDIFTIIFKAKYNLFINFRIIFAVNLILNQQIRHKIKSPIKYNYFIITIL